MDICIRNELEADYAAVEEITRKAFWNIHAPGCDEHFLLHTMRTHEDFIRQLDFVLCLGDKIIGNIVYTKSRLVGADKSETEILTFGPVSVLPEYQGKGYGTRLIRHSMGEAAKLGYKAIIIYGNPDTYCALGFKSCMRFGVKNEAGFFPAAMLVKELLEGAIGTGDWTYHESAAYSVDTAGFNDYDAQFERLEKRSLDRQEVFYILSHARVE